MLVCQVLREGLCLLCLAHWFALCVVYGDWPWAVVRADTLDPLPLLSGVHCLLAFCQSVFEPLYFVPPGLCTDVLVKLRLYVLVLGGPGL